MIRALPLPDHCYGPRRFFNVAKYRKGSVRIEFCRSYALNGFLGSGKPFVEVDSNGGLYFHSERDVQARVRVLEMFR